MQSRWSMRPVFAVTSAQSDGPVPRRKLFDTYWKFAVERQRIFYLRAAGKPAPWTDDPILQKYRFCNAFRACDRESQYLIRSIYDKELSQLAEDIIARILFVRLFNLGTTFQHALDSLGEKPLRAATFDPDKISQCLAEYKASGRRIFSGAFILCASGMRGVAKHKIYLRNIEHILDDGLTSKVQAAKSLHDIYNLLVDYPLIGKFLAYQIATDINYSEIVDFDEDSFTMAGPGAMRGITKCFSNTRGISDEAIIRWIVKHQEDEMVRLGINPDHVWLRGRHLRAIDCQSLLCETDKYSRAKFPDIKLPHSSHIKKNFKPDKTPIRDYFYPPKWGINDKPDPKLDRNVAEQSASTHLDARKGT